MKKKQELIKKTRPWHKERCVCGHMIYWSRTKGEYRCHCSNPKPFNKQHDGRTIYK